MNVLFIEYPKCTTCQKAKKWLNDHQVSYTDRHIVENNPTYSELIKWHAQSKLDIKKFFNTSGIKYRELGLTSKLNTMSVDEQLSLLATDGMLIKRPLIIGDDFILIGFKEAEWEKNLLK
jgi:arsenate reductase